MDDRECPSGKICYSKAEAEKQKAWVGKARGKSMRVYQCPKCYWYHLTKRGYD